MQCFAVTWTVIRLSITPVRRALRAVSLRAEVRGEDVADHAELSLRIVTKAEDRSRDPDMHTSGHKPGPIQRIRRDSERHGQAITGSCGRTRYEVTAHVPGDAEHMGFDLTLTGPGRVGLRNVKLTRTS